ncbi:MAG: hypothetical protein HQL30_05570 [Candidatus Omnitrophica bacterium]|nr:hypothetical protein [Candidatus Omnitrophota bacterium]
MSKNFSRGKKENSSYPLFIRTIALLVAFVFFWQESGFTADVSSSWEYAEIQRTTFPGDNPERGNIAIPYDLAGVSEVNSTGGKELIVNIQDAHSSLSAQYSIAELLDSLANDYELSLVAVEGSTGYIDTSVLKTFPDKDIRRDTAGHFMSEGRMSAGEFFDVTSSKDIALYGIEDEDLYAKNVESFGKLAGMMSEERSNIDSLLAQLEAFEAKCSSEELREFHANCIAHRSGEKSFKGYWRKTGPMLRRSGVDIGEYKELDKLVESVTLEDSIDFSLANAQRKRLIDSLAGVLDKRSLEELVSRSVSFKNRRIAEAEFHGYLLKLAGSNGIDSEGFGDLIKYTRYVSIYNSINVAGLYRDAALAESRVMEGLYRNSDERELYSMMNDVRMLKQLYSMELSSGEFQAIEERRRDFGAGKWARLLRKWSAKYGVPAAGAYDLNAIESGIDPAMRFYLDAEIRNRSIIDNTVKRMREEGRNVAALITGGYHADGLSELMRKKGLSYLIVIPKYAEGNERPYIAVLTNKKSRYEKVLDAGRYQLALKGFFDELTPERLSKDPEYAFDIVRPVVFYSLGEASLRGADTVSLKAKWKADYAVHYDAHSAGPGRPVIAAETFGRFIDNITVRKVSGCAVIYDGNSPVVTFVTIVREAVKNGQPLKYEFRITSPAERRAFNARMKVPMEPSKPGTPDDFAEALRTLDGVTDEGHAMPEIRALIQRSVVAGMELEPVLDGLADNDAVVKQMAEKIYHDKAEPSDRNIIGLIRDIKGIKIPYDYAALYGTLQGSNGDTIAERLNAFFVRVRSAYGEIAARQAVYVAAPSAVPEAVPVPVIKTSATGGDIPGEPAHSFRVISGVRWYGISLVTAWALVYFGLSNMAAAHGLTWCSAAIMGAGFYAGYASIRFYLIKGEAYRALTRWKLSEIEASEGRSYLTSEEKEGLKGVHLAGVTLKGVQRPHAAFWLINKQWVRRNILSHELAEHRALKLMKRLNIPSDPGVRAGIAHFLGMLVLLPAINLFVGIPKEFVREEVTPQRQPQKTGAPVVPAGLYEGASGAVLDRISKEADLINSLKSLSDLPEELKAAEPIPFEFARAVMERMFVPYHIVRHADYLYDEIFDLWTAYRMSEKAASEGVKKYFVVLNDRRRYIPSDVEKGLEGAGPMTQIMISTTDRAGDFRAISDRISSSGILPLIETRGMYHHIYPARPLESGNQAEIFLSLFQFQRSLSEKEELSDEQLSGLYDSYRKTGPTASEGVFEIVGSLEKEREAYAGTIRKYRALMDGAVICRSNGIPGAILDGYAVVLDVGRETIEENELTGKAVVPEDDLDKERMHLQSVLGSRIKYYDKAMDMAHDERERSIAQGMYGALMEIYREVDLKEEGTPKPSAARQVFSKVYRLYRNNRLGVDNGDSTNNLMVNLVRTLDRGYIAGEREKELEQAKLSSCFERAKNGDKLEALGPGTIKHAEIVFAGVSDIMRDKGYTARFALRLWYEMNFSVDAVAQLHSEELMFKALAIKAIISGIIDLLLEEMDLEDVVLGEVEAEMKKAEALSRPPVVMTRTLIRDDLLLRALTEKYGVKFYVSSHGSTTEHVAIIATGMGALLVLGIPEIFFDEKIRMGEKVSIIYKEVTGSETDVAKVHLGEPTTEIFQDYMEGRVMSGFYASMEAASRKADDSAKTMDGADVKVYGNINLYGNKEEAVRAVREMYERYGASGIALGRTEYMYGVKGVEPGIASMSELFRSIADVADKPVTLRTFDRENDKICSALPSVKDDEGREINSFDYYRTEPGRWALKNQVKAIMTANVRSRYGNIRMMFPMVKTIKDMEFIKSVLAECRRELLDKISDLDVARIDGLAIGIMVETLEAAADIRDILTFDLGEGKRLKFLSVGSNDLTSAVSGKPRTDISDADFNKTVLEKIDQVMAAASENGVSVSICGDYARLDKTLFFSMYFLKKYGIPLFQGVLPELITKVKTNIGFTSAENVFELLKGWEGIPDKEIEAKILEKVRVRFDRMRGSPEFNRLMAESMTNVSRKLEGRPVEDVRAEEPSPAKASGMKETAGPIMPEIRDEREVEVPLELLVVTPNGVHMRVSDLIIRKLMELKLKMKVNGILKDGTSLSMECDSMLVLLEYAMECGSKVGFDVKGAKTDVEKFIDFLAGVLDDGYLGEHPGAEPTDARAFEVRVKGEDQPRVYGEKGAPIAEATIQASDIRVIHGFTVGAGTDKIVTPQGIDWKDIAAAVEEILPKYPDVRFAIINDGKKYDKGGVSEINTGLSREMLILTEGERAGALLDEIKPYMVLGMKKISYKFVLSNKLDFGDISNCRALANLCAGYCKGDTKLFIRVGIKSKTFIGNAGIVSNWNKLDLEDGEKIIFFIEEDEEATAGDARIAGFPEKLAAALTPGGEHPFFSVRQWARFIANARFAAETGKIGDIKPVRERFVIGIEEFQGFEEADIDAELAKFPRDEFVFIVLPETQNAFDASKNIDTISKIAEARGIALTGIVKAEALSGVKGGVSEQVKAIVSQLETHEARMEVLDKSEALDALMRGKDGGTAPFTSLRLGKYKEVYAGVSSIMEKMFLPVIMPLINDLGLYNMNFSEISSDSTPQDSLTKDAVNYMAGEIKTADGRKDALMVKVRTFGELKMIAEAYRKRGAKHDIRIVLAPVTAGEEQLVRVSRRTGKAKLLKEMGIKYLKEENIELLTIDEAKARTAAAIAVELFPAETYITVFDPDAMCSEDALPENIRVIAYKNGDDSSAIATGEIYDAALNFIAYWASIGHSEFDNDRFMAYLKDKKLFGFNIAGGLLKYIPRIIKIDYLELREAIEGYRRALISA